MRERGERTSIIGWSYSLNRIRDGQKEAGMPGRPTYSLRTELCRRGTRESSQRDLCGLRRGSAWEHHTPPLSWTIVCGDSDELVSLATEAPGSAGLPGRRLQAWKECVAPASCQHPHHPDTCPATPLHCCPSSTAFESLWITEWNPLHSKSWEISASMKIASEQFYFPIPDCPLLHCISVP